MNRKMNKLCLGILLTLVLVTTLTGSINAKGIAPPPGSFSMYCYGYVKDYNSGTGLSGAKVVLKELETGISKTVYTRSNGYYSVSIRTPSYYRYTLTVTKSGYNGQSASYSSPGRYRKDFSMYPVGSHIFKCYGYVKDSFTGAALSGATVKLSSPTTGGLSKTVTTSLSGYYSISFATNEYKYYNLQASKSNYFTEVKQVYSSGYNRKDFNLVDINMHTFTVEGCVKNIYSGVGISEAIVTLTGEGIDETTSTDYYGYYYISVETPVNTIYLLTVSKTDYQVQTKNVFSSEGTHQVDFYLEPIYDLETTTETTMLYTDGIFFIGQRHYYLEVTTTYYTDNFGEFISSQSLRLYTTTVWTLPPAIMDFTVSYNDGSLSYWKAYSPDEYDNDYMEITGTSTEDTDTFDSFSSVYGQKYVMLRYHSSFVFNGQYYDLGYHTYEFLP